MKKTPRKTPRRPDQRGQRNDTAAHCHAKAQSLVHAAINTPMGIERSLLERSAAAWSMRAEQLSRAETRLVAKLPDPGSTVDDLRLAGPST